MILRIFQLEEWTLIIQKSTVIPPSPIVLFTMSWQLFIIIIMELSHLLHRCQHRSCRHQLHWLRSNLLGSRVSTRWASPHTGIYKKLRICLLSMHWAREEENRALLTCNLFGIWATELWLMDPQPVRQFFTFVSFLVLYIAKNTLWFLVTWVDADGSSSRVVALRCQWQRLNVPGKFSSLYSKRARISSLVEL